MVGGWVLVWVSVVCGLCLCVGCVDMTTQHTTTRHDIPHDTTSFSQVRTYVNGTLYSILVRASLKERAREIGLPCGLRIELVLSASDHWPDIRLGGWIVSTCYHTLPHTSHTTTHYQIPHTSHTTANYHILLLTTAHYCHCHILPLIPAHSHALPLTPTRYYPHEYTPTHTLSPPPFLSFPLDTPLHCDT